MSFMNEGSGPRTFLDTNILVYADDALYPVKQSKSIELITTLRSRRTGVISLQVLQEYFVTVTRKQKLDPGIARDQVEYFLGFIVAEPKVNDILAAIDMHRLLGFSYWDGVEIVNPFL